MGESRRGEREGGGAEKESRESVQGGVVVKFGV
jgi:hypothetical protein